MMTPTRSSTAIATSTLVLIGGLLVRRRPAGGAATACGAARPRCGGTCRPRRTGARARQPRAAGRRHGQRLRRGRRRRCGHAGAARARHADRAPNCAADGPSVTNDQGQFAFSALPAGRFTMTASKAGYVDIAYGAKRPGRPGTPIQLAEGQKLEKANITLPKRQRRHRRRDRRERRAVAGHAGARDALRHAHRRADAAAGRPGSDRRSRHVSHLRTAARRIHRQRGAAQHEPRRLAADDHGGDRIGDAAGAERARRRTRRNGPGWRRRRSCVARARRGRRHRGDRHRAGHGRPRPAVDRSRDAAAAATSAGRTGTDGRVRAGLLPGHDDGHRAPRP